MTAMTPARRGPRFAVALACIVCPLLAAPAWAGPIVPGEWLQFGFGETGSQATGCDPADPAGPFCVPSFGTPTTFLDAPPWTFTAAASGATLRVTDAGLSGDRFEIFDFGISLGLTSLPALGGDCFDDPVPCFADPTMSTGTFLLAAGDHSLTLSAVASPEGGGAGFFRVDTEAVVPVPEPATLTLLAAGLALAAGCRKARRAS